MELRYRSNKTGCYRLVQITWYSGANESFNKLFWPTIDFNNCIRHTPPSLCSYSCVLDLFLWLINIAIFPKFTIVLCLRVFPQLMEFNGKTTEVLNCNDTNVLVTARRSGLTDSGFTYPHLTKTF
jgi:hypothetical protein